MPQSTATAKWNGSLKDGSGQMHAGANAFPFTFKTRMEGEAGSTPEMLLASALAGCYSMALSADLGREGFSPEHVHSTATANFSNASGKWAVDSIDLVVEAKVPGIDAAKFQEVATGTKSGCPVSRALAAGVTINLTASLA